MTARLHATQVDDITGMVRIYVRGLGWYWFTFDAFLEEGIHQWKKCPAVRMGDVRG